MIQITQKTNVVLLAEVKVLKDQATFYEEEKKEAQMQIAELKSKVNAKPTTKKPVAKATKASAKKAA